MVFSNITVLIGDICIKYQYCPSMLELQEAAIVTLLACTAVVACAKEVMSNRTLIAQKHDLKLLKDDIFDIAQLSIFGVILLLLVGASLIYEIDTIQADVILYAVVLATVAVKLKDSITGGVLFVTLSYSCWYGIFRLFLSKPVGEDFSIMLSPQWLASLITFTAPALIANLKYPALIQSSMSLVIFGSIVCSFLVALNASFVFIDCVVLHYDWFPGYAARIASGANYRLYGRGLGALERAGYYAAMVALQVVCMRIPHFMMDQDELHEQLAEQQLRVQEERLQEQEHHTAAAFSHPSTAPLRTQKKRPPQDGTGAADKKEAVEGEDEEVRRDIPADCVEVTAEEAIRLQERNSSFAAPPVAAAARGLGSKGAGALEQGQGPKGRQQHDGGKDARGAAGLRKRKS